MIDIALTYHDPCVACGRSVRHDGGTKFPKCDQCARELEQKYEDKLKRCTRLLHHALEGTCKDPDCEIHNPWMQEDEAEVAYTMAFYVAGAQGYAKHLDGFLEEYQRNITDEMRAPSHP